MGCERMEFRRRTCCLRLPQIRAYKLRRGPPGPGSPVATTCDADTVDKHKGQCSKAACTDCALHTLRARGVEAGDKVCKSPGLQGRPDFTHQVHVVMQVVDAGQHGPEHFATAVQVV